MLGRAWTLALAATPLRVIVATNLLSAILAAGAVFLLFRTVRDLIEPRLDEPGDAPGGKRRAGARSRSESVAAIAAAATAALAFAFHRTLWSVATVTEVHALQMFLDTAWLHAMVRAGLWGRGPFRERTWLLAAYLAGLSLTNHLTSVLLVPAFLLGARRRRAALRPRALFAAVALALLGASAYLYLPIRAAQHPVFNWGGAETLTGFVRHVTGAQYRVWMFASGEAFSRNVLDFGREAVRGFTLPLLLLVPLGWARAARIPGALAGTLAMFALATLYPLGYDIHDVEQYFLAPFLVTAIWIGLGAEAVARWLGSRGRIPRPRAGAAVVALALVPLLATWRSADRSHDVWVESMARSFLAVPAPGGIVLSAHWDVLLSPALYLQQVEGVRSDVVLLDQEHFRRTWNLPAIRRHHPEVLAGLEAEADELQRQLATFEGGEPYDPSEIQRAFEALIGGILERGRGRGGAWVGQEIEAGIAPGLLRVPDGLLLRLADPAGEAALPPPVDWPRLPGGGEPDGHLAAARRYASRMAALGGGVALRLGDEGRARRDFDQALAWDPANAIARSALAARPAWPSSPGPPGASPAGEPNPSPGVSVP